MMINWIPVLFQEEVVDSGDAPHAHVSVQMAPNTGDFSSLTSLQHEEIAGGELDPRTGEQQLCDVNPLALLMCCRNMAYHESLL